MVARVLLAPSAFKISKAGFNVLTASDANMLMSLTKAPVKLLLSGNLVLAPGVTSTVNFGMTLSALPLVFYQSADTSTNRAVVPFNRTGASDNRIRCTRFTSKLEFDMTDTVSRRVHYLVIVGTY